jgi:hypothetical protein
LAPSLEITRQRWSPAGSGRTTARKTSKESTAQLMEKDARMASPHPAGRRQERRERSPLPQQKAARMASLRPATEGQEESARRTSAAGAAGLRGLIHIGRLS